MFSEDIIDSESSANEFTISEVCKSHNYIKQESKASTKISVLSDRSTKLSVYERTNEQTSRNFSIDYNINPRSAFGQTLWRVGPR